jgi:hypothetical protein
MRTDPTDGRPIPRVAPVRPDLRELDDADDVLELG